MIAAGDLRGAFVACQAVLIDHLAHLPEDLLAQLHLTMGQISIAQDKPERARKYLDKAAALRPDLTGLSDLRSQLLAPDDAPASPPPRKAARIASTPIASTPVAPAPVVPAPGEPTPAEPTPVEPTPVEPTPVEPAPAAPAPAAPAPHAVAGPIAGPSVQGRLAWAASFWSRTLAFGLDVGLVCALVFGMLAIGALALGLTSQDILEAVAGGFTNLFGLVALLLGLLLIYLNVFARFGGQTLGKMLLGLRVVRLDGHSLGTWDAARRALGMILAGLPGLAGFVWAGFDLDHRGWHDRVAGTLVVRINPPRAALESSGPMPNPAATAATKGA